MQKGVDQQLHEELARKKMGPNRAKKSLSWPAHADRPGPFSARFNLPFDLVPLGLLRVWMQRAKGRLIRHPLPQYREREGDWIAKGALVAFIYFEGFYTMTSATMCNIMG
jgi:hypothetical protein